MIPGKVVIDGPGRWHFAPGIGDVIVGQPTPELVSERAAIEAAWTRAANATPDEIAANVARDERNFYRSRLAELVDEEHEDEIADFWATRNGR